MPTQVDLFQNNEEAHDGPLSTILQLLREGKREWRRLNTEMGRLGTSMDELKINHQRLTDRVYQIEDWSRKPFSAATVRAYIGVIDKYYNGLCACCSEEMILNKAGVKPLSSRSTTSRAPSGTRSLRDGRSVSGVTAN